jgi:hypothetical protein
MVVQVSWVFSVALFFPTKRMHWSGQGKMALFDNSQHRVVEEVFKIDIRQNRYFGVKNIYTTLIHNI